MRQFFQSQDATSPAPSGTGTTRGARRGFSLVEVTISIGVFTFAFASIFALLPGGLGIFRQAMDTAICAQIAQRIGGDAQETDFDTLVGSKQNFVTGDFYVLPLRHFDDQGTEVRVQDPASPNAEERMRILYTARVRGSAPGKADPKKHQSNYFTSLPSLVAGKRFNPRDLSYLTIQIVNNPGSKAIAAGSDALLDAADARQKHVALLTFNTVVARNGYLNAAPKGP